MKHFIHPTALVATKEIGEKTRVWAFTNILKGAVIGKDCNICDHVFIENDVVIGDLVTVKSGVQIWDGITIQDNAFIGPNATFTNDKFPRSKKYQAQVLKILVKKNASIGANATILPGITIGENAMIGAGAVVTKDVPDNAIVFGNPATITGYVKLTGKNETKDSLSKTIDASSFNKVKGVSIINIPKVSDIRGDLFFGEIEKELPFTVKRFFAVQNVPSKEVIRGEHAHRKLHQFLICLQGSVNIIVDDGHKRSEMVLNSSEVGIYLKPMVWSVQYKYSKDALLLVLASEKNDPKKYIRNYEEFKKAIRDGK